MDKTALFTALWLEASIELNRSLRHRTGGTNRESMIEDAISYTATWCWLHFDEQRSATFTPWAKSVAQKFLKQAFREERNHGLTEIPAHNPAHTVPVFSVDEILDRHNDDEQMTALPEALIDRPVLPSPQRDEPKPLLVDAHLALAYLQRSKPELTDTVNAMLDEYRTGNEPTAQAVGERLGISRTESWRRMRRATKLVKRIAEVN